MAKASQILFSEPFGELYVLYAQFKENQSPSKFSYNDKHLALAHMNRVESKAKAYLLLDGISRSIIGYKGPETDLLEKAKADKILQGSPNTLGEANTESEEDFLQR